MDQPAFAEVSGVAPLPLGTVLERYRIEKVIARGGFGITYLVRHTVLDVPFAMKEHFPSQLAFRDASTATIRATDPDTYSWALDRFLQEGRSLAMCRHQGVVSVADVFEANGTAYLVLGYEDGRSLKQWRSDLGRGPTQAEIDTVLQPLLDALEYVHAQGLLHRDLAPDNIIVRKDGSPCLIDFGSARQAVASRSQLISAIVKAGYSPPEQYTRSGKAQGPWSDIYALAGTVYRLLSESPPIEATERMLGDELLPLADAVAENAADYRHEFLAAIDRALHLDRLQRPQSVAEWRQELGYTAGPAEISRRAAATQMLRPDTAETGATIPGSRAVTTTSPQSRPVATDRPSTPPQSREPNQAGPQERWQNAMRRLAPVAAAVTGLALVGIGAGLAYRLPIGSTSPTRSASGQQTPLAVVHSSASLAEEMRRADEARARTAEETRLAEERRRENEASAEQQRREARDRGLDEQRRRVEEERAAEQRRLAEERRKAEEERTAKIAAAAALSAAAAAASAAEARRRQATVGKGQPKAAASAPPVAAPRKAVQQAAQIPAPRVRNAPLPADPPTRAEPPRRPTVAVTRETPQPRAERRAEAPRELPTPSRLGAGSRERPRPDSSRRRSSGPLSGFYNAFRRR